MEQMFVEHMCGEHLFGFNVIEQMFDYNLYYFYTLYT